MEPRVFVHRPQSVDFLPTVTPIASWRWGAIIVVEKDSFRRPIKVIELAALQRP
jgi:hypothetical protein